MTVETQLLNWQTVLKLAQQGNLPSIKRVEKTAEEWRKLLSAEQFSVLREKGTERPFSSPMCSQFSAGRYACAGCKTPLFDAATKFESGSGWPSFNAPLADHLIGYHADVSHGMSRVEVLCSACDAHLGHVFPDGPAPTFLRFCLNAISLVKIDLKND